MNTPLTKFKRIEQKYILTLSQKQALIEELAAYISPDSHGNKGKYKLESLYYDTPDLKFYQEKLDGKQFRKKIRIRRYVRENEIFDENSLVFIEIKEKVEQTTLKRRVEMKYSDAKNFLENAIIPSYKTEDKEIIDEIFEIVSKNKLIPMAITSYDRQAFFGHDKKFGLRLTFDTQVFYQKKSLELNNSDEKEGKIIDEEKTILEIKVNNEYPDFMQNFLAKNNLAPEKMSKYAGAIEATL